MSAVRILRGRAVLPGGICEEAEIRVRDARIDWAGPRADAPAAPPEAELLEHDGIILPGLIDLHNHGGAGVSFPDTTSAEEVMTAVLEHRRHGTTRMLASLVTASPQTLHASLGLLAPLVTSGELLGVHLEGPFLSPERAGAQNPAHITAADAALIRELGAAHPGAVASMTLAPEAPGADAAITALCEIGAVPSLGHTDADSPTMARGLERATKALREQGRYAPTVTHLFNGMRPIHHRDPGPVLAALDAAAHGTAVVELIADGVHLAPETVAHVFSLAAEGTVALVTDAMAATGMDDGSYTLGSLEVTVQHGIARLTEGGAIAGGTAHLLDVVRSAVHDSGMDLAQAVAAATRVPARVLRRPDLGALSAGCRADAVLVDSDLRPVRVLRDGLDAAPSPAPRRGR